MRTAYGDRLFFNDKSATLMNCRAVITQDISCDFPFFETFT